MSRNEYFPLSKAREHVPELMCAPGTLYRWAQIGIRGNKLASRRIGGRIYTTREHLHAFLNGDFGDSDHVGVPAPVAPINPTEAAACTCP